MKLQVGMQLKIPDNIVEASTLKNDSTIYLYRIHDKKYFLSNSKMLRHPCIGKYTLSKDNTFELDRCAFAAFNVLSNKENRMLFTTVQGRIYITFYMDYCYLDSKDSKEQIPTDFVNMCALDFTKPVYVFKHCKDFSHTYVYLSNESFLNNPDECLGRTEIDNENCFVFTRNMKLCTRICEVNKDCFFVPEDSSTKLFKRVITKPKRIYFKKIYKNTRRLY